MFFLCNVGFLGVDLVLRVWPVRLVGIKGNGDTYKALTQLILNMLFEFLTICCMLNIVYLR